MFLFTAFSAARAARGAGPASAALALLVLLASGCAKHPVSSPGIAAAPSAKERAVVTTARSQIGKHYRKGGATPAGFDCSGFVCWVFRQHGVTLPRETSAQAGTGRSVAERELRPGDLVLFDLSFWSGLHVGIYTGQGSFIHSPSSGKRVREDSLNDPYWRKRLTAARRVL